jgi:hypothetical protein
LYAREKILRAGKKLIAFPAPLGPLSLSKHVESSLPILLPRAGVGTPVDQQTDDGLGGTYFLSGHGLAWLRPLLPLLPWPTPFSEAVRAALGKRSRRLVLAESNSGFAALTNPLHFYLCACIARHSLSSPGLSRSSLYALVAA